MPTIVPEPPGTGDGYLYYRGVSKARSVRLRVERGMRPTSSAQFDATSARQVPDLEQVREGIWALPLALWHGSTPFAFAYFIRDGDGRLHVIDTGSDSDDNWGAVRFALTRIGIRRSDVASITITHMHPDHVGMVRRFRDGYGIPLAMHRIEQEDIAAIASGAADVGPGIDENELFEEWHVPEPRRAELRNTSPTRLSDDPPPAADVLLENGDRLDVPGRDIRVLHTPGHTRGSISLEMPDERLIFTGDHVLPEQFPGIGLGSTAGENPVADYLDALERVAEFDDHEVLPGHGYRFVGLAERCEQLADHRRRRSAEVAAVLTRDPGATTWDIASHITWSAGWSNLHGFFLRSALAQTAMHRAFVLASN
jgi:glyoxylase-like metal-dependent hydrolase (beta-lactamase superfamily II)